MCCACSRLAERLECQRLRAVRAFDRSGAWLEDGSLSAAAYLRHRGRMTHAEASTSVRLARRLERLPETADAFAAGAVNRHHVHAIVDVCAHGRDAAIADLEPQLVAVARETDAREFRSLLATLTDALDGDGGAAASEARYERRRLHVSELLDGMIAIDGILDREGGEIVMTALQRAIDAPRAADGRSTAQRRADALVRVCEASAPALVSGPGRDHRPSLACVVDVDVLERRAGPELARQVRAEAAHVGRLSAATLRRIACDARIARVVTDGRSEPLDVGRTDACDLRRGVAGARDPRPRMRGTGLRPPTRMVRRAPQAALGRRRNHEHRQPRTPLPAAPSRGARRRASVIVDQVTSSAMTSRASGCCAPRIIVVTPASRHGSSRSRMRSFGPMQRDFVDHLERDRGGRFLLLAVEVEVLDLLGRGFEAVAAREVVVEVLAARAHAADVQRDHRPDEVRELFRIVADDHGDRRRDVEAVEALAAARAREAGIERVAERLLDAVRREEDRQPTVGDLGRELHVLRADGREVDRDVGARRVHDDLERLAEAGRAGPGVGDVVVLAVVFERTSRAGGSRARSRRTRAS